MSDIHPAPGDGLGSPVPPTQVRRPWRATIRTIFQALVALATLAPLIVAEVYTDLSQAPAVVTQVLAVLAAVTRVMAMEGVERFLAAYIPFLAAEPKSDDYRGEGGYTDLLFIVGVVLVVLGLLCLVLLAVGNPILDLVWTLVVLVVGILLAVFSRRGTRY